MSTRGRRASIAVIATAALVLFGFAPAPAGADFGFKELGVDFTSEGGSTAGRAGSHPLAWTTSLSLNTIPGPESGEVPEGNLKDLRIQLPAGLVGTPALLPRCPRADFSAGTCPTASALGFATLKTNAETEGKKFPLYNLVPQPGSAAEVGFVVLSVPVTLEIRINPRPPFNLVVSLANASQAARFFGSVLTIDGFSGETPFLTLPRSCDGPLTTTFEADSWEEPGRWVSASAQTQDDSEPSNPLLLTGCADLAFSPRLGAGPTTAATRSPSGLDLSLDADTAGFVDADVPPQSEVREVSLTLPEGVTVNPAVAAGLDACGPDDLARETPASAPGQGCPESSKIGTVRVETPLFDEALPGSLFVARPDDPTTATPGAENPFDALLALYAVVKSSARGVLLTQAMEVEPDPRTGRLVAGLEEMPQLPISHLDLHFRDGPRSPLQSPAACGAYASRYRLIPWSGGPALEGSSSFTIDRGCGSAGFDPRLTAGATRPRAGASSAFVFDLRRGDGEQNLSTLSIVLPPGLSAKFAGVPLCPDANAASGACPASSRVGSVNVAAGTGPAPLWVPPTASAAGVFLAGPYKGAPFSIVAGVPAQAGPFDLGTIPIRGGIRVGRDTGRARVDLDPLPQIIRGIPIDYRAIHLELDRPGFIRNPTTCERLRVAARLTSSQGQRATAGDLFQASGCGRLRFKPRFSLRLRGPIHRGAHPELRAALATRRGDANLRHLAMALPATELLDARHIRNVCTVDRFRASACPAGSVYGQARVSSPLLDEPLRGPVHLRSSDHRLPDLAVSLDGQIGLALVARLETAHGRLRATFVGLPDLPLRKFVLTLRGGDGGLLVNSGGLCKGRRGVVARARAQNGMTRRLSSALLTDCPSLRDTDVPLKPLR